VVANDSVERLRQESRSETLEGVFTALAVEDDVDRVGTALAHVAVEHAAAP
jgi:hypothetical protein